MESLAIVVNSCAGYYDKTVPPLLDSLRAADVPMNAVHVVVGDARDTSDATLSNGVSYHFRKWCNLDNNGMLWLTMEHPDSIHQQFKWVLYLHDTTLVEPAHFWDSANKTVQEHNQAQCIRIHQPFSMGIGFYRVDWLFSNDVSNYMNSLVNYDASNERKMAMKRNLEVLEDTLFKHAMRGHGHIVTLPNVYNVVERNKRMYGTDMPRIVEFYSIPGIYKIKANWDPMRLHTAL